MTIRKILIAFVILILVLLASIKDAMGQSGPVHDDKYYKKVLKISPAHYINSTFLMTLEQYLYEKRSSLVISPGVILKKNQDIFLRGATLETQYRIYLSRGIRNDDSSLGFAALGFYTAPYLHGLYFEEDYYRSYWLQHSGEYERQEFEKVVSSIAGGLLMGLQIDVTARFVVDLFVGGGFKWADVRDSYDDADIDDQYYENYGVFEREYTGIVPKGGLMIGFNF